MMKNLRISKKLLLGFLIVTALSVLLAGIGIVSSISINGDYTYLLDSPVERERNLREMQLQFSTMRYRAANYVMNSGDETFINETAYVQYQDAYATLLEQVDIYVQNSEADTVRDAAALETNINNAAKLQDLLVQYNAACEQTRTLSIANDTAAADASLKDVIPLTNEINTLLSDMLVPAVDLVHSESDVMDTTALTFTVVLLAVSVVCVALSIVLALYISGMISKPIVALASFMKTAGTTGNIAISPEGAALIAKLADNRDEIGSLSNGTAAFVKHVTTIANELTTIADGNLTAEVHPLSGEDTLGLSLRKMCDNLNRMFGEIRGATSQVSTGAGQVSSGAQSLAQGATQQAASIQELSSEVAQLAQKTKENSELAEKSAKLADTIKGNAQTGSRQMDEMMAAVKDINEASQSISKVIKTIDDIAFQTNILALNAAVEAARAGDQGKGFAVVADEVRNLAAKSAEAAKETEALIADSRDKAELGERIAGETAASLSEIVEGIHESGHLSSEIARSSEEQSAGIHEINLGIDQVAQVVQQNSATAEESAAAAEEMSGQSEMLREMIGQFRLKDSAQGYGLLAATQPASARAALPETADWVG